MSAIQHHQHEHEHQHQHRKWWQISWFSNRDTKEERRLIVKLDLLIVPYAFLAYWTKYIDQANISISKKKKSSLIQY